jgi:hypothetical protein
MRKLGRIGSFWILLFFLGIYRPDAMSQTIPDTVEIGSYVISLHDLDFHNKEYDARFWVWMIYKNPEFDFAHRVEVPNAKDLVIQDIMTDTLEGDKIWVLMKLKCTMKQNWRVHNFPFDKQHLEIAIENSEYDTRKLVFKVDSTGAHFDPKFTVDGWNILNFKTQIQNSHYQTDFGDPTLGKDASEYASYVISMELTRNAWGLFLKLFIGMYISFLIALISFNVDQADSGPRFELPVGGLFGSIGNKYIIDTILPESSLFSLVDSLHALTFISIFVILAISVYSLQVFDRGQEIRARKIDKMGRNYVMIIYLGVNVVLVFLSIFQ